MILNLKMNIILMLINMKNNIIVNDRLLDPEKSKKLTEQANSIRRFRGGNVNDKKEKEERDQQNIIN